MNKQGIVCKVWNISGDLKSKTVSSNMKDSVSYILNKEKTDGIIPVDKMEFDDVFAQMERECKYVENDIKTAEGAYIGTVNLISDDIGNIVKEMIEVKEFYEKKGGRAALHGIISLPIEESDIKNSPKLMRLCDEMLREIFPNNQAVYAVHTNTENLHIHFIVNSVGLDGKKIHQNNDFIKKVLHPCVNKLAEKYGFSKNKKWIQKDEENCNQSQDNKQSYVLNKIMLRSVIDKAIEQSDSFDDFVREIKRQNITVNIGKHISLKTNDMKKAIRSFQLGENYSKDAIIERILIRKEAFPDISTKTYAIEEKMKNIVTSYIVPLKKYKDMNLNERKYIIGQLKLGRNPWREHQITNWQISKTAKEINDFARIESLVNFYANNGKISDAMNEILIRKKQLAQEKKMIQAMLRKYKPIIDIYERMKKYEKKAYLYEHKNMDMYRMEFENYRILTRRLKQGYNKDVLEISDFIEECENKFIYIKAQLSELSTQYREIRKYGLEHGQIVKSKQSLLDSMDIYKTRSDARNGSYGMKLFYIVSKESDKMLRVIKSAKADKNGKMTTCYDINVLSASGEIIEKIKLEDDENLINSLKDIQTKYNLNDCKRYSSASLAHDFLNTQEILKEKPSKSAETIKKKNESSTTYSFTQAININAIKGEKGEHFILNRTNPNHIVKILTTDTSINIKILALNGKLEKQLDIPTLTKKTAAGYQNIQQIKNEFNLSEDMLIFNDVNEAKQYIDEQGEKEQRYKNR